MAPSTTPMAENRAPASAEQAPADTPEQAFAKLKNNGNLAYFTPDKMKTGSNAVITARIAFADVASSALTSGIDSQQSGSTHVEATPVTSTMKMKLSSADFAITPWSTEEQTVGGPVPTEWKWQVAPLHSGTLRLHLAAVVVVGNLSRDFTTVDRTITVQVDPVNAAESFFNQHAQWILGGVLTGIGALFSWWWKRRK